MNEYLAQISFIENLKSEIITPIMSFLLFISFIYFLYGVYVFIYEKDIKKIDKAKNHILWGLVGLFIVVAARGILGLVSDTVQTLSQ